MKAEKLSSKFIIHDNYIDKQFFTKKIITIALDIDYSKEELSIIKISDFSFKDMDLKTEKGAAVIRVITAALELAEEELKKFQSGGSSLIKIAEEEFNKMDGKDIGIIKENIDSKFFEKVYINSLKKIEKLESKIGNLEQLRADDQTTIGKLQKEIDGIKLFWTEIQYRKIFKT